MKIAAIVILYYPDDNLLRNIESYNHLVNAVYIFDNSETPLGIAEQVQLLSKVSYHHDGENEGIAKRLNQGMRQAINDQYDWVLTMDQDSYFPDGMFEQYLHCVNAFAPKENVAMFGPHFGRSASPIKLDCEAVHTPNLITSGSMMSVALFKKTKGFDEALFIDSVDHDYCIQCAINGFVLIQFPNIFLQHQLGSLVKRSSIKTFFIAKKSKVVHAPIRCYYIYRNLLYLQNKYAGAENHLIKQYKITSLSGIRNSIFYGRQTVSIIQYLLKAHRDFKKRSMGKLAEKAERNT